ncbi:MAG TPA: type II CAAX endopeptidase family protein [Luteitalea sp.]|nr:type II CAAX endopeptidase family protein [Luteitalea sp.]
MVSDPDSIDATPEFVDPPVQPVARRSPALSLLEVLLCSGFPTMVLIGTLLVLAGVVTPGKDGLTFPIIVTVSLIDAVVVLSLILLFLRIGGERPSDVLLGSGSRLREVWRGIAWMPLVFTVVLAVGAVLKWLAPWKHNEQNPFQLLMTSPGRIALFALVAVVAGGIREEVQRGFILHRFDQDLGGAKLGLVLFSVAFGLGHYEQGYDAMVITGVLGMLWGMLYLGRRSVIGPAVSHALFNLIQIALFQYASRHGLLPS